jgi:hypothetical protein
MIAGLALHSLQQFGVLLAAFVPFNGYLHWTAVFIPLVLLPIVILTLGSGSIGSCSVATYYNRHRICD